MNDELKIWLMNGTTLFISMQTVDFVLKFILLAVTIGYTITKWYSMVKKDPNIFFQKKRQKKNEDNKN